MCVLVYLWRWGGGGSNGTLTAVQVLQHDARLLQAVHQRQTRGQVLFLFISLFLKSFFSPIVLPVPLFFTCSSCFCLLLLQALQSPSEFLECLAALFGCNICLCSLHVLQSHSSNRHNVAFSVLHRGWHNVIPNYISTV